VRETVSRTAAAIIATAALALLAAACGSSRPATGAASGSGRSSTRGEAANSTSAVRYSGCMRSHGVPNFPDPGSNGQPPKTSAQRLGVSSPQLQAAQQACQHLLPNTGSFQQQAQQCFLTGDCPPALVHQILTAERRFAQCMRAHGVPNWPDPTIDSEGRPGFAISISKDGFDPDSQFRSQQDECGRQTGSPAPRAVSP
jgi:hypothetical protein